MRVARNTKQIRISEDLYTRLKARSAGNKSIGDILEDRFNREDEDIRVELARLNTKINGITAIVTRMSYLQGLNK